MTTIRIPSATSSRGWPLTAAEEATFVGELVARGGVSRHWTSADVNVLMEVLRSGGTIDELTALMPATDLAALASAYRHLATVLSEARQAWDRIRITATTGMSPSRDDRVLAQTILPGPVRRLDTSPSIDKLLGIVRQVDTVTTQVHDAEAQVHGAADADRPRLAMALLHLSASGEFGGLLTHDDFLASRVGMLSPRRVTALLGQ